jgi:hypothetical protein
MSLMFLFEFEPSKELFNEVEKLALSNPFYTLSYIKSMSLQGNLPVILSLRQNDRLLCACPAYISSGFLYRKLIIDSLPDLPEGLDSNVFWNGLMRFCEEFRISDLTTNSFASTRVSIPSLPSEVFRKNRWEFVIELQKTDLWKTMRKNHRWNIKRARKVGLTVRRAMDDKAYKEHVLLQLDSKKRREKRGEIVTEDIYDHYYISFIKTGAGQLYQAVKDNKVFSSVLLLMAERGVYAHSAGTSPEGMKCGATHFLWYEVFNILKNQNLEIFNLSGVDQLNSGLAQFKTGFRGARIDLESARFYFGNVYKKKLRTVIFSLRNNPKHLFKSIVR